VGRRVQTATACWAGDSGGGGDHGPRAWATRAADRTLARVLVVVSLLSTCVHFAFASASWLHGPGPPTRLRHLPPSARSRHLPLTARLRHQPLTARSRHLPVPAPVARRLGVGDFACSLLAAAAAASTGCCLLAAGFTSIPLHMLTSHLPSSRAAGGKARIMLVCAPARAQRSRDPPKMFRRYTCAGAGTCEPAQVPWAPAACFACA
jgi:hypothetical protein